MPAPRIGRVTVDTDADEITITGAGFDPAGADVKVELGKNDDEMKTAEIISKTAKTVTIKDDGWINNVENIRVTGYKSLTAVKKNVYLVNGKKSYEKRAEADAEGDLSGDAYTTDGKYIYNAYSSTKEVSRYDPSSEFPEIMSLGDIDVNSIFEMPADKNKTYGLLFGKDLVYANGIIYNVAEYGPAAIINILFI